MENQQALPRGGFPSTRLTIIQRLRGSDPEMRRGACGDLVEGYWKPVYKHLRLTWRMAAEDARDTTQAFFTDAFHKQWLERYEPGKARFRTFVRLCVDRFVMNQRQAAQRLKRGGGGEIVPVDFAAAERELQSRTSDSTDPDEVFHQEFVRALFERAVADVRREYGQGPNPVAFQVFERYDLAPVEGVTYAQLAADLGLTTTQVTNYLAQARRRFRERALDALRGLCGSSDEFRREARELFGVEVE